MGFLIWYLVFGIFTYIVLLARIKAVDGLIIIKDLFTSIGFSFTPILNIVTWWAIIDSLIETEAFTKFLNKKVL